MASPENPGTPGPWFVDRRRGGDVNILEILTMENDDTVTIAQVLATETIGDVERADAARIAAVPKMEAAIMAAIDRIHQLHGALPLKFEDLRAIQDDLRAALA